MTFISKKELTLNVFRALEFFSFFNYHWLLQIRKDLSEFYDTTTTYDYVSLRKSVLYELEHDLVVKHELSVD